MNYLSCVSLLCLALFSQVISAQQYIPLELPCYSIPNSTEAFCTLVTPSPHGPFDDVVFYKRDSDGQLTFLRTVSGTVATFSFQGTSPSGKYTALAWAEEGHPIFEIYRSAELLQNSKSPMPLVTIAEYPFSHLDEISDDGNVIYGSDEDFQVDHCDTAITAAIVADATYCHRTVEL